VRMVCVAGAMEVDLSVHGGVGVSPFLYHWHVGVSRRWAPAQL
jgi:hypothetical protein